MAIQPVIEEENPQYRQEQRSARIREERAKSRADLRHQLAEALRSIVLMLVGAALIGFFALQTARLQAATGTITHKLAAKAEANSTLKKAALAHEHEVDEAAE